jgi:hypothetical protein
MIRERAERQLADTQRETPKVQQAASAMADLSADEFVHRVTRAFEARLGGRPS